MYGAVQMSGNPEDISPPDFLKEAIIEAQKQMAAFGFKPDIAVGVFDDLEFQLPLDSGAGKSEWA